MFLDRNALVEDNLDIMAANASFWGRNIQTVWDQTKNKGKSIFSKDNQRRGKSSQKKFTTVDEINSPKKAKKEAKIRYRQETIIISNKSSMPHEEIRKNPKADPNPENWVGNASWIRRTQNANRFQLKSSPTWSKLMVFLTKLRTYLRSMSHIQCKDFKVWMDWHPKKNWHCRERVIQVGIISGEIYLNLREAYGSIHWILVEQRRSFSRKCLNWMDYLPPKRTNFIKGIHYMPHAWTPRDRIQKRYWLIEQKVRV